jgi:uncharacterized SAM-binding protein YcdF (DUF218 family)
MSFLLMLALPSGLALGLALLGLLMALLRRRLFSWCLLAASAVTLGVFSTGVVATALMSPLEYAYPVVKSREHPEARHIVVLTGWASDDPELPLTGRMNPSSAFRVLLALELYHERPDCDVVVSGKQVTVKVMAEALEKLGVPRDRLRIEDRGNSTTESAAYLQPFVGDTPFFLVTSGGHMPRSMAAMSRAGLKAIAAPTDHQLPRDWRHADWQPAPTSLAVSDLAVHEYLARTWERWRGAP